mgnify:FL=1
MGQAGQSGGKVKPAEGVQQGTHLISADIEVPKEFEHGVSAFSVPPWTFHKEKSRMLVKEERIRQDRVVPVLSDCIVLNAEPQFPRVVAMRGLVNGADGGECFEVDEAVFASTEVALSRDGVVANNEIVIFDDRLS